MGKLPLATPRQSQNGRAGSSSLRMTQCLLKGLVKILLLHEDAILTDRPPIPDLHETLTIATPRQSQNRRAGSSSIRMTQCLLKGLVKILVLHEDAILVHRPNSRFSSDSREKLKAYLQRRRRVSKTFLLG